MDFMALMRRQTQVAAMLDGPSCIPGIKNSDLCDVDAALIRDDAPLHDPALRLRVKYWQAQPKAVAKQACKDARCRFGGNMNVLSLRLALAGVPDQAAIAAHSIAAAAAAKRKSEAPPAPRAKKPKLDDPLAGIKVSLLPFVEPRRLHAVLKTLGAGIQSAARPTSPRLSRPTAWRSGGMGDRIVARASESGEPQPEASCQISA